MHIPLMPSIANLPGKELRKSESAFQVLEENLGTIEKVDGDGNCRYYAMFKAFEFLEKDRNGKKLYTYKQKYSVARTKRNGIGQNWEIECGSLHTPP